VLADREVVVLSAVRTPIGKYGGSLKDFAPADLGSAVVRESIKRAGVDPRDVGHVVIGNVIHTEPRDMYISRVAAVCGGVPAESPAFTVNRLCGSGLQAIISAAQAIQLGDADAAIGGGVECMSRAQYWLGSLRWGQRMNNGTVIDAMVGALTDPFDNVHMAITAETVAARYGVSREDQDKLAVQSHLRAADAIKNCVFKSQILPMEIKTKKETTIFDTDEGPRADTTYEALARLKPVFDKNGTITAGNASTVNDGAAAVLLMERRAAEERGLKPMARLVDYAVAGVDPKIMGMGPVPAVRKLLDKQDLDTGDIDVFEVNEAFAAQALAVCRELDLPDDRTNPNGSGISLGHPIGATGAVLSVKAVHELQRIGGRYALVTMCIGGGQGIAALFESIN
jgi:acetyl-CoA C-acetyltransferase